MYRITEEGQIIAVNAHDHTLINVEQVDDYDDLRLGDQVLRDEHLSAGANYYVDGEPYHVAAVELKPLYGPLPDTTNGVLGPSSNGWAVYVDDFDKFHVCDLSMQTTRLVTSDYNRALGIYMYLTGWTPFKEHDED